MIWDMRGRVRVYGVWLMMVLLLLTVGCRHTLLPSPYLQKENRGAEAVPTLLAGLRTDWEKLRSKDLSDEDKKVTVERYNRDLLHYMRRIRYDYHKEGKRASCVIMLEHKGVEDLQRVTDVFDDIIPAADITLDDLEERYRIAGVGVPLVGVIPAMKLRNDFGIATFRARGAVCSLTAIMEFRRGEPVLRLIPRHECEDVRIGNNNYRLAGDFSASIEMYWNLTEVKKDRFLGLLRPQRVRDSTGLICMERYDPKKIPVILVHGLASSAATFGNMVNRLMSDPRIRQNFQFWYYNYPTGLSWVLTAKGYRTALQRTRDHFDPKHVNKNWERMIVVGHSMGGLITHYSQCVEPWKILGEHPTDRALVESLEKQPGQHDQPDNRYDVYYFRPVQAGGVVYMATPHRGAPIARNRFVMLLTNLVSLPTMLVHDAFSIATLRQDNILMNPGKIKENYTSIRQLSPDSYSIRGLAKLRVRDVPTYSIIGDRGYNNSPRSSDGIVPYWSSHIAWGHEDIVNADHHVQDSDETVPIFSRILHAALRNKKLDEGTKVIPALPQ